MSKNVTSQVIDNLKDDSFPSILLLSGKWGCGKTYIAKHSIIPALQQKYDKAHYVSLYGVSSLDDFRDKLVSLNYFDSKNSVKNYSMIKNVVGNVAKGFGDKGATLALANTLAKPMKHKLLSKMNNCAFIVDDLERASSKQLTSEVLGECLNLVENNTNTAILVLANEDHVEDKSILEKTFNDKVVLTTSPAEIVQIINEKYSRFLDEDISHSAHNAIAALQLSNLRIVQRVMQRYIPIQDKIEGLPDVDRNLALSSIIEQVFRICYVHYEYGANYAEICEGAERYSFPTMPQEEQSHKDEKSEEVKQSEERLKKISNTVGGAANVTPALVSYCLNTSCLPNELVEDFNLPLKGKLLDRVKSFSIYDLSDSDFAKAIMETKEFLFDKTTEPKHFFDWFIVLNSYFFFIENMFIPENIDDEYVKAKAVVEDTEALKPISSSRYQDMSFRTMHPLVDKLYNFAKPLNDQLTLNTKLEELQLQFLASWSAASTDIYKKYEFKPFLHQFDVDAVCQAFKSWEKIDIVVFGQFIESRYSVRNIRDYLEEEFEFIRQLKEHLETTITSMPNSRLKGCFNLLVDYLDKGVKLIEKAERYNPGEGI